MNKEILLTIFTPAYNRAHTLPRTYESLCKQACKQFAWLIVDDGGYGILREYMEDAFGKATATELARPDFVKLAESFGVPARRCSPAGIREALEESFTAEGPNVVVVEARIGLFAPTHLA